MSKRMVTVSARTLRVLNDLARERVKVMDPMTFYNRLPDIRESRLEADEVLAEVWREQEKEAAATKAGDEIEAGEG